MSFTPTALLNIALLGSTGILVVALLRQMRLAKTATAERKRIYESLEESELRFRILTRATNEAVWDWNLQTNALWWNRNVETLFGHREEDVGMDRDWWTQRVHFEDHDRVLSSLRTRTYGTEDFWSAEYRFRRADGSYADIFDRGYILRDHGGHAVRMIGSMMDVTKRRREMELARARDAALESGRLKSQFLANMSHEIRTPMNSIIGMTDILLNTELTSEQREFMQIVRMSGESLLTIINDILDFSKIEAGKLKFEMVDFEPRAVLEEVIVLLAEQAGTKELRMSSSICSDVPGTVCGDPGRLRQVLTNLASNAIKFTPRGEVTIRAAKEAETDSQVVLRFEVTDTGIGIPQEARACLFQPFSQIDASTTRKYGGTGLGLAICKQLVGMMAGEIGCDSVSGKGSTFWFTARFDKSDAVPSIPGIEPTVTQEPFASTSERPGSRLKQTRILVAEDNAFNQKVVLRQLREMGFGVDAVANGIEVLEALNRIPYDLILMDCQMPEMDGYACAAEIRRQENNLKHVPIVAMTAHVMKEDRDRCLAAGMDDFLSKPVRVAHLENVLTNWLGKRPVAVPPSPQTTIPTNGDGNKPPSGPVDMEVFMEVAGHNAKRLGELAGRYITQTTGQLTKLRDAVAAGAASEIRTIAHSTAGSSAMCGMTQLVELLRHIELLGHEGRLAGTPALYTQVETEFERVKRFLSKVKS